ncbi:Rv1733c family protein [Streptomyces bicolor]|uniref:Rv1733c family protein n=1 Tax=Streptomyces bicolor TaxID=66874 RepID=UPI001F19ADCE|nr:hypothetical protein [Streptomyces bicolor]
MLWRLRRNPLRRRSQAWIGLGLLLAALAATPAAMFLVGDAAYHPYTRTAQHQAETRHRTTAVLLEDARRHPEPGSAEAEKTRYPTKVRFTDPNGHTHTATTDVQPALPKGSTIRLWAGTDGKITDPPLSVAPNPPSGLAALLVLHTPGFMDATSTRSPSAARNQFLESLMNCRPLWPDGSTR